MTIIVCYIDGERMTFDEFDNTYRENEFTIDGGDFILFDSSEDAGKEARKYWEDMAQDDPKEFTYIIGEKALIAWGLGQHYAPGYVSTSSLKEWLDLHLDFPEEHFATEDGRERTFKSKHPDFSNYNVCYKTH